MTTQHILRAGPSAVSAIGTTWPAMAYTILGGVPSSIYQSPIFGASLNAADPYYTPPPSITVDSMVRDWWDEFDQPGCYIEINVPGISKVVRTNRKLVASIWDTAEGSKAIATLLSLGWVSLDQTFCSPDLWPANNNQFN